MDESPSARSIVRTGSDSHASPRMQFLHVVIGLAEWATLIVLWWWLFASTSPPIGWSTLGLWLLVGFTGLFGLQVLWVTWNTLRWRMKARRARRRERRAAHGTAA